MLESVGNLPTPALAKEYTMFAIQSAQIAFLVLAFLSRFAGAQQPAVAAVPAPIPAQIFSAHKVFLSNAGYDAISRAAFERAHEPNRPYNDVYAALKRWGRFELVATPADADLVFAVRFTFRIASCEKITSYQPELELTILDSRTHFSLWTITEPVEGALRKNTWDRNFDQGVTALMEELRGLAGGTSGTNVKEP
jgi:hypothetical protein